MASRTLGDSCKKPLHEEVEEGPKKRVGVILENPWVELLVVLLIVTDVVLVAIELGIDHYWLCISGQVVAASPETIATAYPADDQNHHLMLVATTAWSSMASPFGGMVATFLRPVWPMLALADLPSHLPALLSVGTDLHVGSVHFGGIPRENSYQTAREGSNPRILVPADPHGDGHDDGHGHGHDDGHGDAHGHAHGDGHGDGHGDAHGVAHGDAHGAGHGHDEHEHGAAHDAHGGHDEHHAHAMGALVCEDKHGHNAHHIMHTCHTFSVAILLFFLVELLLKFWINPTEFLACKLHLLDTFVVVVSLIMDVYISYLVAEAASDGGKAEQDFHIIALLVILRFWRVVRIVHGFSEISLKQEEKKEKELEEKVREVEEQREEEVAELEEKVRQLSQVPVRAETPDDKA